MFDQSVTMEPTFLKDFPRLQAFKERFEVIMQKHMIVGLEVTYLFGYEGCLEDYTFR